MKIEKGLVLPVNGLEITVDRILGNGPGVVFFGGYSSVRFGEKASALWEWAMENGRSFIRFDYSGHGGSIEEFTKGTLGQWRDEALAVVEELTREPQILVGSSMGGWISLLVAGRLPEKTRAVVTVACAADFTVNVVEKKLGKEGLEVLSSEGILDLGGGTIMTKRFIDESREHLLLGAPIEINCPAHLIHGLSDERIPWETSLKAAELIASGSVAVELVKSGDHRLSTGADISRLIARIEEFSV
ncbi:MAG: alpha/beta hydrolase [Deltaproteobacteria bacterium]|nr:MAG: alpha/beta hydrolase [Deltaproteobacteria bacterium]